VKLTTFRFDSIDSTNLEAGRHWQREEVRQEALASRDQGERWTRVFVAAEQTAGRGRPGKSWTSPAGGLWFSCLWPALVPAYRCQGVPLLVGLAVAEVIRQTVGLECQIKWPNDLLIRDRKLAGILCELDSRPPFATLIIGVGINVNFPAGRVSPPLGPPAATLLDELGQPVDNEMLLRETVGRLTESLPEFEDHGLGPLVPSINQRLAWLGTPVTLARSEAAGTVSGTLRGIDEWGRVTIDVGGDSRKFMTGELRPDKRAGC
jgi:BirA family transcriptional regulator, biotin operon repressor / biotin---[acetyl-CoA-carboxylase] ligase